MLRQLEATHDHVIGYSLGGEVSDDEYGQLLSELRDAIALHGRIRVLFRLQDLSPKSFFTALDDRFRFFQEHGDAVERMAIVSTDTGGQWLTRLADVIGPVDTRHFDPDDEQEAWAWLE